MATLLVHILPTPNSATQKIMNVFLFYVYLFILFIAVLGLRFCARAFSSCGKWGPLFIAVRGPLTIVASLVAEHRLQTCRLSNCGSRAQLLRGMRDLPRPGLEPVSPALAGRFSTTAPPGKPFHECIFEKYSWTWLSLAQIRSASIPEPITAVRGRQCSDLPGWCHIHPWS